ncbi:MAG TPA: efflux RND transporter periplasmic adaptor subunit [Pseudolabrys sp.]
MHGEVPKHLVLKKAPGRWRRNIAVVVVLIGVAGALYYVFAGSAPQQQRRGRFAAEGGPIPVLVTPTNFADVPVYLDAVGTTLALNTVTVKPQVDGKLISIDFNEGQNVNKGDVIARIDPITFQATYDQAVAKKAQDEAILANSRNDLIRYQTLITTNAINKQQLDTQKALVDQNVAQVQSDQAAIESARATLSYTKIVAPLTGRTGIRQVDEGNIVHAADTTGIVVITQIQPISVTFNLPQQNLERVNAAFAKGPLEVDALRADTNEVIDHGTLMVVDNQVDATTGTVKLKANFPNADLRLWPGQFVNVRLLIDTLKHVAVIPTGAVQRGPNGTFVYVVNDQNTASVRNIKVQKQDEDQTVVSDGIAPPERVVTTGFARLTDGAKISLSTGQNGAPAAAEQGARAHRGAGRRPGGPSGNGAEGAAQGQRSGSGTSPTPQR